MSTQYADKAMDLLFDTVQEHLSDLNKLMSDDMFEQAYKLGFFGIPYPELQLKGQRGNQSPKYLFGLAHSLNTRLHDADKEYDDVTPKAADVRREMRKRLEQLSREVLNLTEAARPLLYVMVGKSVWLAQYRLDAITSKTAELAREVAKAEADARMAIHPDANSERLVEVLNKTKLIHLKQEHVYAQMLKK